MERQIKKEESYNKFFIPITLADAVVFCEVVEVEFDVTLEDEDE